MKFTDYRISETLKVNLEKIGWKRPTDIQFKTIPHIINGEDVLAIAQTGTGKTAAFAIPIISNIHEYKRNASDSRGVKCLVMVPTRELAIQITEVFNQISKHTKVKVMSLFGGVEQDLQISTLKKGVDVVIATPGRMFDLASQGHLNLRNVETLILDEADHMLDLGFVKDIEDVIERLPKKRQTLFFSATINDKIKKLAYSFVRNAIRIQISPKDPVSKNVNHKLAFVEMDDKRFFLENLIKEREGQKILVFVRTKVRAERVHKAMERVAIKTLTIHGDKDQKDRMKVLEDFKKGKANILIATDVTARGIDIQGVECVVNYDLPDHPENYVHRVGRTGRGTSKGDAITFCSTEEREILDHIQGFLGSKIDVIFINPEEYEDVVELSEEHMGDWQTLMKKDEIHEKKKALKKKVKKKKK